MAEVSIPLADSSWIRNRAEETIVPLVNRFFEENPTNPNETVALLERPALIPFLDVGTGPGRRLFQQPGFSTGDLFHVTGNQLYKHHMKLLQLAPEIQTRLMNLSTAEEVRRYGLNQLKALAELPRDEQARTFAAMVPGK